ncbi:MAG TPA: RNA polymerase sigma factor [Gemmatales bacterium]|nr:RNA polymerase sigma factor [Gemmatales bacterium]
MAQEHDDWASWMEQHGSSLVLLAQQYVGCRSDAEDVVHEAFVSFWRSRHQAQDWTAYLFSCVKHAASNWMRSKKRRSKREEASARPEVETWFAGNIEKDEWQKELLQVIAALPTDQREVLVMKIWGGLSFPQIAQALEVSANTAASRYPLCP